MGLALTAAPAVFADEPLGGGIDGDTHSYHTTDDEVTISGTRHRSGESKSHESDGGGHQRSTGGEDGDPIPHPNPDALPAVPGEIVPVDCTAADVACRGNSPAAPAAKGRVIPAVTVSDLVSFRPAAPGLSSEPDGVGVVGLPTNLLAGTGTQTLHGVLFEFPVAVRFTPDRYTFAYGDGHTATTRTPGRAWAASGDPQFTPTTTSHAYRERGTFTATVTVSYSPAVDFGDGVWRPVAGFVTSTSVGQRIRVYEAHTALVAHTCTENPTGPGC